MRLRAHRLAIEPLEGRATPAGNVTASLAGGSLVLIGDAQANALSVTQAAPGEFTVTGQDGTTVNGQAEAVTFTGVTTDVIARLAAGDDRFQIDSATGEPVAIGRDLVIDGGTGDNTVGSFSALKVGRDLRLSFGAGDDRTELFSTLDVGRDVTVNAGAGDNTTSITPFFGTGTVAGDLRIVNGLGASANTVADTTVRGDVTFASLGSANNTFALFGGFEQLAVGGDVSFLSGGRGENRLTDTDVAGDVTVGAGGEAVVEIGTNSTEGVVTIGDDLTIAAGGPATVSLGDLGFRTDGDLAVTGDLVVRTGGGADALDLRRVQVGDDTTLTTGAGDDTVRIDDSVFAGQVTVETGPGADALRVEGRYALDLQGATEFRDRVEVELGRGDDVLQLGVAGDPSRLVRLAGRARFDGGSGSDLLDAANVDATGGRATYVSFERTAPPPLLLGPVRYAVGEYVLSLITADFNNDGVLDLATANQDSETISVLLGNGDGTFQPQIEFAAGRDPFGLVSADFNADGKADLAVANDAGSSTRAGVTVFLGNGDGTFAAGTRFAAGPRPTSPVRLAVADVNEDGKADLVTVNRTQNASFQLSASVSVLTGNGDGTFAPATVIPLDGIGTGIDVAVGDVNADGNVDVVAGATRGMAVILGNGDGTFQAPAIEPLPVLTGVTLADLNRDGRLDLVVQANRVQVRLGNGDGTFGAPVTVLDEGPTSVAVGDFNRDGIPDLAVTHFGSPSDVLSVLLGNGDGTFRDPLQFTPGPDDGPVAVGDFNADGFVDVAVGNQEFQSVSVFLNSGKVTG